MRVVLDTNVLVSGLFWEGIPRQILDELRNGNFDALMSDQLFAELTDVVSRPKFSVHLEERKTTVEAILGIGFRDLFEFVPVELELKLVEADPDDNAVLACALISDATYIVSGDRHLLELPYEFPIPVITPERLYSLLAPASVQ